MRFIVAASLLILLVVLPLARAQEVFDLDGKLIQGTTEGAPLAESYALQLLILNEDGELVESRVGESAPDGTFAFSNVPLDAAFFYAVTTTWAGIEQSSIPLKADEISGALEFPLYEITNSLDTVVASDGNLRLEFNNVEQVGMQVLLELTYVNLGDQIVYQPGGVFTIELPVGALGIATEESGTPRFQSSDTPPIPSITDTQPLVPNVPYILRASFFVPYSDGAVFDMRFPFALNDMAIFLREKRIEIQSDLHIAAGEQTTSSGRIYRIYAQSKSLVPGEPFKFTLLGNAPQAPTTTSPTTTSSGILLIVLGGLAIFGGLMAWFWTVRRMERQAE